MPANSNTFWRKLDLYTDALLAAPIFGLGLIMIWATWGDRFGIAFGLFMVVCGIWMGARALIGMNERRE